jgi:hypothetical protein
MDIFSSCVFLLPEKSREEDSVLRLQTESETVNSCVSRVFTVWVSLSVCLVCLSRYNTQVQRKAVYGFTVV